MQAPARPVLPAKNVPTTIINQPATVSTDILFPRTSLV